MPSIFSQSRVVDLGMVGLVVAVGTAAIALEAGPERRSTHMIWLSIVLAESVIALLFRRRHPVVALVGISAGYLAFDAPAVSLLPLVLALASLVSVAGRRTTAVVATVGVALLVLATPIIRGALP